MKCMNLGGKIDTTSLHGMLFKMKLTNTEMNIDAT